MLGQARIIFALVTTIGFVTAAIANEAPSSSPSCAAGTLRNQWRLSPEKLAISGALFTALCAKRNGELVNGEDIQLDGRFVRAIGGRADFASTTPPRYIKGKVILAFIVEKNRTVSWVSVLESSGD